MRGDFELKPFMDSSDLRASWQIANTVLPYAALWWVADWSRQHAPLLLIPTLGLMVLLLARCFSLMHDCGHDSLFRHRRANQVFGFLLGVLSAIPQYPWSRGHAYHHRHNGDWEKYQGPSALVTTGAFAALPPGQKRVYRWLRHPLMLFPGGFFYLVIKPRLALLLGLGGFFPHLAACLRAPQRMGLGQIFTSYRSRHWYTQGEFRHLLANNIAVIGSWWLMAQWLGAGVFWSLYAPVMACAAAIFICIFFVQHNFPGSYAHATAGWSEMTGVLEGTSDLELPPLLNWFSADIGCHAIHHLSSKIPNYRLRACQARNAHLLQGVRRLSLADIPGCFSYILWDPQACRLTTIEALATAPGAPAAA
ncbi:fatty acid desaturase [Cyanobium sp. Candia 9D4]|uniref:fatty acid desaturase n=1 Tax=Cyanobium sp. Candia 9D4 TaxID=2823707 RepID=UPI0020CD0076|nr:fatty acid desaturase [Cyanobium sp. Candia 9D4]